MSWSVTIAKPISTVLSPFPLSVVALLMVTYVGSSGLPEFTKWAVIILFFLVVLPLAYAYARTSAEGSGGRRMPDPLEFFRQRRRELWIIGLVCAAPCTFLLIFLDAPSLLVATLVALLGTSLAVAVVNRFFRASYHLSALTTVAIVSVLVWDQVALPIALLVAGLVGWARYSLRQHSLTQLAAGFGLALVITTASFYSFRLL